MNSGFSYQKDLATFPKGKPGVKTKGFVCTSPSPIDNPEQAIEIAKKEITVEYDTISVEYDKTANVYKVNFSKEYHIGGNQSVYVNKNGIYYLW